jgi:glycosyltransferase involved in cell wall biosynthesis
LSAFLLITGVIDLILWAALAVEWYFGMKRLTVLKPGDGRRSLSSYPTVSIVVAARDEEKAVGECVGLMLAQDYPDFEIIVVDDRSTDRTGAILDDIASEHDRVSVIHVTDLPAGWLGKTHALQVGFERSTGEWLLFADADVEMVASCLRRAVEHALTRGVDHLPMVPRVVARGAFFEAFIACFSLMFFILTRPWRALDPRSKRHVGIGAFNLIRRGVYEAVGTFKAIALRPDDDLKLGKLVKKRGFKQEFVFGGEVARVLWYESIGKTITGLTKNAFAGVDYSVATVVFSTVVLLYMGVFPFAALFFTGGLAWALYALTVLAIVVTYVINWRYDGRGMLYGLLSPISTCLFLYAMCRSMVVTLAQGGIVWRGTKYPLDELKKNVV